MDTDELREEIQHQRELQKQYRKRLRVLEQQVAKFGIHVPAYIQIEIDEINEMNQDCEQKIQGHKDIITASLRAEVLDNLKMIDQVIVVLNLRELTQEEAMESINTYNARNRALNQRIPEIENL